MTEHYNSNQDLSLSAGIFTVCLCTLFGANAVAIKVSLTGLGVFTTAGLRFGIASIAIFSWASFTGRSFVIKKGQIPQLLVISVLFSVQMSLFYLGLSKSNASRGTLLLNIQPFFVLFLAHFFIPGDRITARKTLGIIMGFSGVAFVFLEKKGVYADFQIGDLMILTHERDYPCLHAVSYRAVPYVFCGSGFFYRRCLVGRRHDRPFERENHFSTDVPESCYGFFRFCGLD